MGVIDSITYTLTCSRCGASEAARVVDFGSSWNGSSWRGGPKLELFETEWTGGGAIQPDLRVATCRHCSIPATVSIK